MYGRTQDIQGRGFASPQQLEQYVSTHSKRFYKCGTFFQKGKEYPCNKETRCVSVCLYRYYTINPLRCKHLKNDNVVVLG